MVGLRASASALVLWVMAVPAALAADRALAAQASAPEWRALLHYPRAAAGTSYVDDPAFFLAANGYRDPAAELRENIARLAVEPELRCRFPARLRWLQNRGLLADLASAGDVCDDYQQWRAKLNVTSITLVLASSYLNSPSSMYGHTFLRLDPAGERGKSDFLSYALNFGANIPEGENGLLYAYRGLFGGYPGRFSLQPYYQKIQEYTRLENRDMWEYQLDLSGPEIDRLLRHVWELRDINFDYYFFDENCSYRLLELLEVARPGIDLTSPFEYAAMPVDTVREVIDAGLVAERRYRPSKRREVDALLDGLTEKQRTWARRLALGQQDSLAGSSFSAEQRRDIYLAAYRYLRLRSNREVRSPEIAERSLNLLRALQQHGGALPRSVSEPSAPEVGHRTSLLALTAGYRELGAEGSENSALEYADMQWRISYHDLLDGKAGYPVGASLMMGNLALRWQDQEGLQLQRFDVIDIRSLSPRDAFFSPLSWQVQGGAERLDDAPNKPLVGQLNASAGPSWRLLGGTAYAMPALRLEYNSDFKEDWGLAPGMNLGQVWQGNVAALELAAKWRDFGGAGVRKTLSVSANYGWTRDRSLRLSLDYRDQPWGHSQGVELSWRQHF